MRKLHGTYVHRGDGARRRARLRRWAYGIGFCAAAVVAYQYKDSEPAAAEAAPAAPSGRAWAIVGDQALRREAGLTVEPAGIRTLSFCMRSTAVVASKRCSTAAVAWNR